MHVGYSRNGEELEAPSLKGNLPSIGKNCEIQIPKTFPASFVF